MANKPVIVVENDPFTRLIQIALDPTTPDERIKGFADFMAHDEPDFAGWIARVRNQSVFHTSQFTLIGLPFERRGNRLGVAYLHGRPGTPGHPEFDTCYENVSRRHEELDRVQVSNRAMEELVLETGIAPAKVFRIPIGVDTARFRRRDAAMGGPLASGVGRRTGTRRVARRAH